MVGSQYSAYYSALQQHQSYDVEILMGNDGPLREACESSGIPAHVIPFNNVLVDPLGDARALLQLTRHWRRTRPDIVQTHSSKAGMLGRAAARLAGVPVVIHTYHGPSYHDRQAAPVRWAIKRLERIFAPLADHIVSVADTLTEDLVRDRICSRGHISTVVSGINFDAFPSDPAARRRVRAALGIPETSPAVIAIGYLTPAKGYDTLVEAASRVAESRADVHYLIVGPVIDSTDFRDELVRRILELSLTDRVHLLGYRDDVPDLLCASDVFVQTSWREGLSRALVEAMYAGLAVVATDVNATREIVRDGETGVLIPPGDPEILARHLLELLDDPAGAAALGNRARQSVGTTRGVDAMTQGLDRIYRRLAEAKGLLTAIETGVTPGEG